MEVVPFDKFVKGETYLIDCFGYKFRHSAKFDHYRDHSLSFKQPVDTAKFTNYIYFNPQKGQFSGWHCKEFWIFYKQNTEIIFLRSIFRQKGIHFLI